MDAVASVGMLAKDAERFRSGEDGDEEVAERRSQAPDGSGRGCAPVKARRARAQRGEARGTRGAVTDRSERWSRRFRGVMFDSLNVGLQTSLNVHLACRLWRAISHRVLETVDCHRFPLG